MQKNLTRISVWALTALLLFPCLLLADAGTSGWTIFTKALMVKYAGIASVAPGYSDISAVLFNPALPATMMNRQLSLMSERGFADDICGGVVYGTPALKGVISGGFSYYDLGSTELNWVDSGQLMTQTVQAQRDMMGFVSYARRVSHTLCLGVSVKGASSDIAERQSATAAACDAGASLDFGNHWSFSGAARNIGSATKFLNKEAPLPAEAVLSGNYTGRIAGWYYISSLGGSYSIVDEQSIPEGGIELGTKNFIVDFAYRFNSEEFPLNFGLGIVTGPVYFQYIFTPGMNVGAMHRLGVTYRFLIK